MTLIACTLNFEEQYPVFIGDVLLTSLAGDDSLPIPTHNEGTSKNFKTTSVNKPYDLAQKIYILRDNVCICLAGRVSEMKSFLEDFRIYCNALQQPTIENIASFLNNHDLKNALSQSAYLISVVDKLPDNTLRSKLIYYPEKNVWDLLNTKRFGSAFLCGSGKGRFGQLLNGMKQPLTIDKNLHPLIDSLNANLSTMVQFISLERFNPYYTVSDYWGAGFELIYWTGQVFEKLGEYAFIIHNAEYDKNFDIGYPIPNLILYYKYIGQDLLVTALDIKKAEQIIEQDSVRIISKFGDYSQYSYVVPTIDKMGKPISTDNIDFSFSTNILILGYTMNAKDKVATLPHISLNNPGAGLSFHVNGDIEYIMTKTIVDQLRENGNNAYKNRHAK